MIIKFKKGTLGWFEHVERINKERNVARIYNVNVNWKRTQDD